MDVTPSEESRPVSDTNVTLEGGKGAVLSITKTRIAGIELELPARSIVIISSVWIPSGSVSATVQKPSKPASAVLTGEPGPPKRIDTMDPASAIPEIICVVSEVTPSPAKPVSSLIETISGVSGATESISMVRRAESKPVLPAASIATATI